MQFVVDGFAHGERGLGFPSQTRPHALWTCQHQLAYLGPQPLRTGHEELGVKKKGVCMPLELGLYAPTAAAI